MEFNFETDYYSILGRMQRIDPIGYGENRNYIDGAVTYLSHYISRGVISTKQVLESTLKRGFRINEIEPFVKELCWRDYFQRVAQHKDLSNDIRQPQQSVLNREIPKAILDVKSEIDAIDLAIVQLYSKGYVHNHCRMYIASVVCNISKSHWLAPSKWMYYHLLDGDWASNIFSWQWLAAASSIKKYYANQVNINKYAFTNQQNTFLDSSYDALAELQVPDHLRKTETFQPEIQLTSSSSLFIDPYLPTFIYNYYNLDAQWHCEELGNRILLLEPEIFTFYSVSANCISFMLKLSQNILGIQVYVGSFKSLYQLINTENIYFKEHPLNIGHEGIAESREWIAEEVNAYYSSFFGYWKQVKKYLKLKYS